MFAGIGGFRTGLTRAGGFRCVGHCEIDKYANASYEAIYEPGKEERYYHDAPEKYFLSSAQVEKLLYKSSEARKAPVSTTQTE